MLTLTRLGRSDLAYELATQTSYPSWGYMISQGATTVWELWQYKTGPAMNSHHHPAFGSVGAWFYTALAGIDVDERVSGYRLIRIRPQVVRDLTWASASVETLRGMVSSSWTHLGGKITLDVIIPVNSVAEVSIPKGEMTDVVVREGNQVVWENKQYRPGVPGLSDATEDANRVTFKVGSGHYVFVLASG
jgi:alpha-L-rhamnosidase